MRRFPLVLAIFGALFCASLQAADLITTVAGDGTSAYGGDGGTSTTAQINTALEVFVDSSGNVFLLDHMHLRKVDAATGIITTIAGSSTSTGFGGDAGPAKAAKLGDPRGLFVNSAGNIFIADSDNDRIRKVDTATGVISTVVGGGASLGDGGPAASAKLSAPRGVFLDSSGNIFIADSSQHRIRKVTASTGNINTIAGTGTAGFTGDGFAATAAQINSPYDVNVDVAGNIYFTDAGNHCVRKVDSGTGNISTVAGTGTAAGFLGDGASATAAQLNTPQGIAVDGSGNIYISDFINHRIRKVDNASGNINTIAGNGSTTFAGDGGPATSSTLNNPLGICLDSSGNLYIADRSHQRIRKVGSPWIGGATTAAGVVGSALNYTISANSATSYSASGLPAGLSVNTSNGVISGTPTSVGGVLATITATNASGSNSKTLRIVIDPKYIINTFAGTGTQGFSGDNGPATSAELRRPSELAFDPSGNLYVGSWADNRIRKIDPSGIITTVAGTGTGGFSGDGAAATAAQIQKPSSVATDSSGNFYIGEDSGRRVRKVTIATGIINTVAGNGGTTIVDGAQATATSTETTDGVIVDAAGDLLISSSAANMLLKVSSSSGVLNILASSLNNPHGLALDTDGNIYVCNTGSNTILKLSANGTLLGTVAGNGTSGFSGDGGPATAAQLNNPQGGLVLDGNRSIVVSVNSNQRVRKIDLVTGIITTIAGTGTSGFSGDGGIATSANLSFETSGSNADVKIDSQGNIYIADTNNQRIRKLSVSPYIVSTLTATGQVGSAFSYLIDTKGTSSISYSTTTLPAGLSLNGNQISGTPTSGAVGTTSITLTASNSIGSDNKILALTINPPPAPVINSATSASGTESNPFSYTITATNNPQSFNATGLPAGLSVNTSTGAITGTPSANGSFSVTISATNSGGTGQAALNLTINAATPGAPIITSVLEASGTAGSAFSYTITASNSPTSFGASGLPAGLTLDTSTGVISGTPSAAGNSSVSISATNASGTGSTTLSLTINEPVPVITSAKTAGGVVGSAFSYTITASGNPTSFGATGLPDGLSVNTATGVISGTPTARGASSATISASNATGTASATLDIGIVLPGNQAPAISGLSATANGVATETVATGTAVSFTATASDPDGDTLIFSWDFKDGTSATGNPVTHTFSIEGNFAVTVVVSDGVLSDTRSVTIKAFAPASGGTTPDTNTGAKAANPLDGTTISVLKSNGGVVEFEVALSAGDPNAFTIKTTIDDLDPNTPALATVTGSRPVFKFTEAGIYVITVVVTDANGQIVGQTRITLPISANETGVPAETPTAPSTGVLGIGGVKGKFLFKLNKPDVVSFKGTFELPAGLTLGKERACAIAIGNVGDTTTLDAKGKAKNHGAGNRIKSLAIKYPRLKKPATTTSAGMKAGISFTLSVPDLDVLGFSTEGVAGIVRPDEQNLKAVTRSIQVALVHAGYSYRGQAPVDFKLSKKQDTGQLIPTRTPR